VHGPAGIARRTPAAVKTAAVGGTAAAAQCVPLLSAIAAKHIAS
jgi:hypothetical protein